jgi:hypothetical protein
MSEFTAPEVQNNFINTRLLANITDSSLMLQFYNAGLSNLEQRDIVSQVESDEILFYNDVVVTDKLSPFYNEPTVSDYINTGILSDIYVKPVGPSAEFGGITGSCHTISNTLKKTPQTSKQDHLEVFYTTDINDKLKVLVYRDTDGLSFSMDGGNTITNIPSNGLLYPAEVTSVGIQNAQTVSNTGKLKIWIGTLREGLKSYTVGDASWISESNLEKTTDTLDPSSLTYATDKLSGKFLFKESWINKQAVPALDGLIPVPYEDVESDGKRYLYQEDPDHKAYKYQISSDGLIYAYFPGKYEPVYILGIVNNPISAGIPLVVFVKGHTQVGVDIDNDAKCLTKYLLPEAPKFTLDPIYNLYREELEPTYPSYLNAPVWNQVTLPTTVNLVDVVKSVQIQSSQSINTSTSGIVTAVSVFSDTFSKFCIDLLKITVTNHVATEASEIQRGIVITKDNTLSTTIGIEANRFTGLSTYNDVIFITERETIWRFYKGLWAKWLEAQDTINEKNTRITPEYKFSVIGSTSYISGLRGFGILKSTSNNYYTGILNTDLGHMTFDLVSTTDDFMSPINGTKALRKDLFSTSVRDFQVIPEVNIAVSCGLKIELVTNYKISKNSFGMPVRTLAISPKVTTNLLSTLSKTIKSKFYKNYTHGNSGTPVLYNKNNVYDLITPNTDQLYLTTTQSETVAIFKGITDLINYVDNRTFDWVLYDVAVASNAAEISGWILRDYLRACTKYNRMKLLLSAVETVTLNNYTLETQTEIPLVLDFDYQILSTVSGYVYPQYVNTDYIIGTY